MDSMPRLTTLLLVAACGPGTNTTDASTGDGTSGTTAQDTPAESIGSSSVSGSDLTATTGDTGCPDERPQDGTAADCIDCETVCAFVVAAACAAGPPDPGACVFGCMDVEAGACGILYEEALACIGSMPTFTCNAAGQPSVDACMPEFDALYRCLG